ncbi:MAG: hypothetical protein PVH61_20160 [Candidatus Aminicenantes bacterium]|jgi:hypothetical protein
MFKPQWKIGDWWVIETIYVRDISEEEGIPPQKGWFRRIHRFEVIGTENMDGEKCFVITVTDERLKSDYLYLLHFRMNNLSLKRIESHHRSGDDYISGDRVYKSVKGYKKPVAAVPEQGNTAVPMDWPLFPTIDENFQVHPEDREIEFIGWTNIKRQQNTKIEPVIIKGEKTFQLKITISGRDIGTRKQLWLPNQLWWIEWESDAEHIDGFGNRKARLLKSSRDNNDI